MTLPKIYFTIPGHVVPSQRVHKIPFVKSCPYHQGGGPIRKHELGVRGVTPGESEEYMQRVAMFTMSAVQRVPEWKNVKKDVDFRLGLHVVRHARRGDFDNIAKGVCDGMQGIAYENDNRIVQAQIAVVTDKRQPERVEVALRPLWDSSLDEPMWKRMAREAGWRPPNT